VILLDTNVLSELMRARPEQRVLAWVDAQPASELVICSITVAEIFYGIARMANGKRRQNLLAMATTMFEEDFAGGILSFDAQAAECYAEMAAGAERRGHPLDMADLQIAAIAQRHGAVIATRNTRHFNGLGVALVDPWACDLDFM